MTAKALARGPLCASCCLGVLQSFAALAGVPVRTSLARRPYRTQSRAFSSLPLRREQEQALGTYKVPFDNTHNARSNDKMPQMPIDRPDEMVPWYLHEDAPKTTPRPFSDRQRIPDLPQNPPPILNEVLQHISVDIGLDDLTLLDLRRVDPPPALGANLLMIIGTARSVKHLNVSADRLCRWLRTKHKLTPFADGLLGRNELKLKLRRKTRRAKLLSSVGSSMSETFDDGITTGWVCVNIGEVNAGVADSEGHDFEKNFVGFGRRSGGTKIVVQILTEQKREELDLERLWGDLTPFDDTQSSRGSPDHPDQHSAEPVGHIPSSSSHSQADPFRLSFGRTVMDASEGNFQRRSLHTRPISFRGDTDVGSTEYDGLEQTDLEPRILGEGIVKPLHSTIDILPSYGSHSLRLRSLQTLLENVSVQAAVAEMGDGPGDRESTSFLRSFYDAFASDVEGVSGDNALVSLYAHGVRIGHPGYSKDLLLSNIHTLHSSGRLVLKESLFNVGLALFSRRISIMGLDCSITYDHQTFASDVKFLIKIIADMPLTDANDANQMSHMEQTFLALHETIASQAPIKQSENIEREENDEPGELHDVDQVRHETLRKTHDRLHDVMEALGVDWSTDESRLSILKLHADSDHWDAFWRTWSNMSLWLKPRSPKLYQFMFQTVRRSDYERRCLEALRVYVPMMNYENPPVKLEGDVAGAVLECLEFVEPKLIEHEYRQKHSGTLARLWNRANRGLETPTAGMS